METNTTYNQNELENIISINIAEDLSAEEFDFDFDYDPNDMYYELAALKS